MNNKKYTSFKYSHKIIRSRSIPIGTLDIPFFDEERATGLSGCLLSDQVVLHIKVLFIYSSLNSFITSEWFSSVRQLVKNTLHALKIIYEMQQRSVYLFVSDIGLVSGRSTK